MNRLLSLLTLALAFSASPSTRANTPTPNFVILFIDDMGYGDIGPFGSTKNRTPNLDRMAAEGLKLTSFYAAPVCSASRAQLMTGSYAPRVSVPGVFFPAGPKGLHPDEITVADYLSELGYATACFGKWHLGDQPEFLPTRQGFDTYVGIPYSNDMGRVSTETGQKVHPLMRDERVGELLEDEGQRRITRIYTEETVGFIEKQAAAGKPFFVYLPHTAMHVPLYPHPDFVGRSENGTYGDWVEEVDWSVGQVLDTLRRLDLAENTLVLFTSDNGPWASKGENGGESGPLRGSKGGTLEGGVREPTIAWWPGRIEAGRSSDAIAGTTDVLPTFVALAGGAPRPEVKIDGVDLTPLLLGKSEESSREAWHYFQGTRLKAIRSGRWKLALEPQSIGMGFKEQPEDIRQAGPRLYDLEAEIGEVTNVADAHPEVVARLQKIADTMVADIGSGQPGPGVRPPGVVEKPVTLYPSVPRETKPKQASGKPLDWERARIGEVFASASAPAIAGKPFTLGATISAPGEGVILSHGGSAIGYVLYLTGGKAVFAVRRGGNEIIRLASALPPTSGREHFTIVAALRKDGTFTLDYPGQAGAKTAKAEAVGLLSRHPQEDLSIGHDARNPVDPEAPKGRFTGKIEAVRVTVD